MLHLVVVHHDHMMKMMLMMKIVDGGDDDDSDDDDSDDGADQGVNHVLYGKTPSSLFSISEQDYCPSLGKDDEMMKMVMKMLQMMMVW